MEVKTIVLLLLVLGISTQATLLTKSDAKLSKNCKLAILKFEKKIKKATNGEQMLHYGAML